MYWKKIIVVSKLAPYLSLSLWALYVNIYVVSLLRILFILGCCSPTVDCKMNVYLMLFYNNLNIKQLFCSAVLPTCYIDDMRIKRTVNWNIFVNWWKYSDSIDIFIFFIIKYYQHPPIMIVCGYPLNLSLCSVIVCPYGISRRALMTLVVAAP